MSQFSIQRGTLKGNPVEVLMVGTRPVAAFWKGAEKWESAPAELDAVSGKFGINVDAEWWRKSSGKTRQEIIRNIHREWKQNGETWRRFMGQSKPTAGDQRSAAARVARSKRKIAKRSPGRMPQLTAERKVVTRLIKGATKLGKAHQLKYYRPDPDDKRASELFDHLFEGSPGVYFVGGAIIITPVDVQPFIV